MLIPCTTVFVTSIMFLICVYVASVALMLTAFTMEAYFKRIKKIK